MGRIHPEHIFMAIDIGTTKICALIAGQIDNRIELLGIGHAPSYGLKKGIVVDMTKTIDAIKLAVEHAQQMAGLSVPLADIGISGAHIRSLNSHGMATIKKDFVTHQDVAEALQAARAVPIPPGQQILHVLPQYFRIDGQERIQDPMGMFGMRLEVQAHIVMGCIASVHNMIKCCQLAGIQVNDIILEQLASAQAVLSYDERELGVAMIDIGGGTADVALYKDGNIRHTMVLPIAGNHFTHDLAVGLRITIPEAERIKKEYGWASLHVPDQNNIVEIELASGQEKSLTTLQDIADILAPRAHELLWLVNQEIIKYQLQSFMCAGVVLTGGGSLLKGMAQLAENIFQVPARVGRLHISHAVPDSINNPMYATGYGLLIHAIKKRTIGSLDQLQGPLIQRVFSRMKSWIIDFF